MAKKLTESELSEIKRKIKEGKKLEKKLKFIQDTAKAKEFLAKYGGGYFKDAFDDYWYIDPIIRPYNRVKCFAFSEFQHKHSAYIKFNFYETDYSNIFRGYPERITEEEFFAKILKLCQRFAKKPETVQQFINFMIYQF